MKLEIIQKTLACGFLLSLQVLATKSAIAEPISFETHIRPMLTQQCGHCHGSESPKNGLNLTTREGLIRGGKTVRVRLTDGRIITGEKIASSREVPVQPFTGELASKERPQHAYEPSLDPVRTPGRFVERDRTRLPVRLGKSSPPADPGADK